MTLTKLEELRKSAQMYHQIGKWGLAEEMLKRVTEMEGRLTAEAELAIARARIAQLEADAPCTCPNPDGSYPHEPTYAACYKNQIQTSRSTNSPPTKGTT